ncbi:MAG: efflux RND transporter permease subunit [Rhodothermaceae bacterium]
MLNAIIDKSLKNRLFVLVFTALLMVAGGYISSEMDVDVFPDLTAPTVTVFTEAHGMDPEQVEQLVTYPLETAINGSPGIRRIRSSSGAGISILWAEFDWGTDIYKARQIVAEKLSTITEKLPTGVSAPVLAPISALMGEIMVLSIQSDELSKMDLRSIGDWDIRQRLLAIRGVAQVIIIGGEYKQYQILASPEKMKYYNITLEELKKASEGSNLNASGGFINEYGNQYLIRAEGRTTDVNDIANTVVKVVDDVPIKIGDVANVKIAPSQKIGDGSSNAKPAIIMTVQKQPEANTLELTKRIDDAISNMVSSLPGNITFNTHIFRQAKFIEASINNLQKTLIEGIIFVILVLFVFLMNYRATLISLLAIPLSLLVSIIILHLLGFTINTMSLGGLAIAIGVLVDDAIIDVENVFKHLRRNAKLPESERKNILKVVYDASVEIRASILNATLIIIVAFIPLFFLSGMEGRLLYPLGIAFIVSVLTSLIVALTTTPVLSSFFFNNEKLLTKKEKEPFVARMFSNIYKTSLTKIINFPKVVIAVSLGLFIITLFVLGNLGRSFLPEFNEGALTIAVANPPGSSIDEANKTGNLVEEVLLSMPEISVTARRTGRSELDEHVQSVNAAEIDAPFTLTERSKEEFLDDLRGRLQIVPGAMITIGQPISHRIDHMLSGTRANIAIKLFGKDLNKMFTYGNRIKAAVQGIEGLVDVNVQQQIEIPHIKIKARREMLAKYGITLKEFTEFVDIALAGEKVGQVYEGQKSYDLILRFAEEQRSSLEAIKNALIDTHDGTKVPLEFVADIKSISGPFTVNRENVQRKVVVSANVAGRDLRSVVNDVQNNIAEKVKMEEGYRVEYGGLFESEEKASRQLMLSSIMAIFVIFILLFQEFKNLKLSLIILLNLPLALIGGVFFVYFTSGVITIAALIGFISLFGIATRNGILLIARYQALLASGKPLLETTIQGSLDRLNPILMTALTTGLALTPLAYAGDLAGNEIQSPMAIVILGGLLTATFLSLLVIPTVYYIIKKRELK